LIDTVTINPQISETCAESYIHCIGHSRGKFIWKAAVRDTLMVRWCTPNVAQADVGLVHVQTQPPFLAIYESFWPLRRVAGCSTRLFMVCSAIFNPVLEQIVSWKLWYKLSTERDLSGNQIRVHEDRSAIVEIRKNHRLRVEKIYFSIHVLVSDAEICHRPSFVFFPVSPFFPPDIRESVGGSGLA